MDFPVHARVHFSVGVPGVPQPVQEGVHAGSEDWWKTEVKLKHGSDCTASVKKAVSLEMIDSVRRLKSFVLLSKNLHRTLFVFYLVGCVASRA